MKKALPHLVPAVLVGAIYLAGGLDFLEHRLLDARFRFLRRPASADLVVVAIDAKSLHTLDVWPWPRGYHATVLENLLGAEAERVAFDVDFSSRSIPEEDKAFEEALAASGGRVILPVFRQASGASPGAASRLVTTQPLQAYRKHVTLATINIRPESDGLVRQYWVGDIDPGSEIRSLAAELADVPPAVIDRFDVDFGIDSATIPRISYVDVLTGQFEPNLVYGKKVLIGATAIELGDQVTVPLMANLPGPLFQALAYECLHQGRALVAFSPLFITVLTLAWGLLFGWLFTRMSWRRGLIVLSLLASGFLVVPVIVQSYLPLEIETSPWVVTVAVGYVLGLIRRVDQQALSLILQAAMVRRTESMMRHVVEASFDAIVTVNEEGEIVTYNSAALRIFGYTRREAIGMHLDRLVQRGLLESGDPVELAGPQQRLGRRKDGSSFPVEVTMTRLKRDERNLRVVFLRDITDRRAHEEALEHQATHDALTDLPNRVLLRERLESALRMSRKHKVTLAVMILDLDGFREINDTLGHQVGDEILRIIAQRLQRRVRTTETIARLGGDEFAALLPATAANQSMAAAERLADALAQPIELEGLSLQVDTSIGIAIYPEHGEDATTLIRRADVAMYVAKRNKVLVSVYNPELDSNSVRQLTLRGDLRRALERDELVLYYQPKVSTRGQRIEGVEALIRWNHPEHGLLFPDSFIGIAEQTGLISPVTLWVVKEAAEQGARWTRQGFPLHVSVNLSARNLMEQDLPDRIEDMLRKAGFPARQLTLEITESVIVEDPKRALDAITKLVALGVKISIDDFGTGYSSLGYLKEFPASELKIDKSFVMGVEKDKANGVIVRSTIDLAHNLGMQAIAEGVENEESWQALQFLKCDFGQGYHFTRPIPADQMTEWIRSSAWGWNQQEAEKAVSEPTPV